MKTTNEVFKALDDSFKSITAIGSERGWELNDEETMVVTYGAEHEGLYVWRFYESGATGYLKADQAIDSLTWSKGWFGTGKAGATWDATPVYDDNRHGLYGGPHFALTYPEFKKYYLDLVRRGKIDGVQLSKPEVKKFEFPEPAVSFYIDGCYFQTQADVDKFINTKNLKIVLGDGLALSAKESPVLQKIVKNLIDNRELVNDLLKAFDE